MRKTIPMLLIACMLSLAGWSQVSTKGTDFWMGFIEQFDNSVETKLWISGETAASGTVSIPLTGWSQNFTVAAGGSAIVTIPSNQSLVTSSEVKENKGVHITSGAPVTVVASTYTAVRTETALILPTTVLGSQYYITSGEGFSPGSEFMVVATTNNTSIDITPSAPTAGGKAVGAKFTITLNAGEVYQVQASGSGSRDLTGSYIAASPSNPCSTFAVMAGATDAYMPANCGTADPLFEMMIPVERLGKEYTVAPLTKVNGSVVRIVATQNGTSVSIDGGAPISLNAGKFTEQNLNSQPHCISASQPVLVAQYLKGNTCTGQSAPNSGDPDMMMLQPNEKTITSVAFQPFNHAWIGSRNINVIMKTAYTGQLKLDGAVVGSAKFTAACNGYSYAALAVAAGTHTLAADSGFIAYSYGYGTGDESYSNPLGWSIGNEPAAPVATAAIDSSSICPGSCVNISATASGANGVYTYTWSPGIGSGPGPHNVCPSASGTYTVTVTSTVNCKLYTDTAVISVAVRNDCNQTPPAPACNLVPNPGFETGACPTAQDQVPNATPWTRAGGSPDYFGKGCTQDWTASYYRQCSSRMAGFYTEWHPYNGQTPDYREYVQAKLTSPLVAGTQYCVTFYVRWANNMGGINTATDNLGAYFTPNAVTAPTPGGNGPYNVNPQIESPKGVPINTNGWVAVTGSFTAAGGEQYITIGNFRNYANTTFSNKTGNDRSYYFVDDVSVIDCNSSCLFSATVTADKTNLCPGECANISATASGGSGGPYTYSWSPNIGTGAGPFKVCPSATTTYTVTVTDNNGCTVTTTATTTINVSPSCGPAVIVNGGNICPGSCFSLSATATGGTAPYTYTWSPTGGNASAANVCPATTTVYTVTVTDNTGATSADTATVTVNPSITLTTGKTDIVCSSANTGSATATLSGGTAPFTFAWSPGGETTGVISNLAGGTYTVTATDSRGCSQTSTVVINASPEVLVNATATHITCNGAANGTATATPSAGTLPYTFAWTPAGGTGSNATGLSAGTYTVTVTDNAGCSKTATAVISEPPVLTATTTSTDIACNGGADGTATVTAGGGVSPYTYSWTPAGSGFQVSGLTAGSYTVTVTDNNGCTKSATASINEPSALTLNISMTPAQCGKNDGSATVAASGATPAYTYAWSPGTGSASTTYSSLAGGTYTVLVTDSRGCSKTSTITVTSNGATVASITASTGALCNGSADGTATASGSGGTAPFTYSWSNGANGTMANNLAAGTYTVTVTDATGCPATASVTINQPAAIILTTSKTDANCGGADGSATVTASGGAGAPFTYTWSPATGSANILSGIPQGTYTVSVSDANGCSRDTIVSIGDIGSPAMTTSHTNVKCSGQNTGSICATVSGGIAPYTYAWLPSGGNTSCANNLPAGTYTLSVTGNNGCTISTVITVTEPSPLAVTTSKTDANCGAADGSAAATITGGTAPYTYAWSNGGASSQISSLSAQFYTVTATDANGCTVSSIVSVNDIGAPSVTAAKTDVLCNGQNTGAASAAGAGGVLPYTYTWSNGASGDALNNVPAGTYTITLTGNNGCKATVAITISEPSPLDVTLSKTDELCSSSNGTATVSVTGGTPGYSYFWSHSDTASQISSLTAQAYTVTVTDANGCTRSAAASLANNNNYGPRADFTMDPAETEVLAPVIRFSDLSNGAASWAWTFGDGDSSSLQNPEHTYKDAGKYEVCLNIVNLYGCPSSACKEVAIKPVSTFYIPNAFTPDGDGRNELFGGKGENIVEYTLYIYDRWGDLVFKSDHISRQWDGKVNGGSEVAQEDVYVYIAVVQDALGKVSKYTGSVTLVR